MFEYVDHIKEYSIAREKFPDKRTIPFPVGNGHISMLLDEWGASRLANDTFNCALRKTHNLMWEDMATKSEFFSSVSLKFIIDDEEISIGDLSGYCRKLNFQNAAAFHSYRIKEKVSVKVVSYIHADVDVMLMDIAVESIDDKPHDIEVVCGYSDILCAEGEGENIADNIVAINSSPETNKRLFIPSYFTHLITLTDGKVSLSDDKKSAELSLRKRGKSLKTKFAAAVGYSEKSFNDAKTMGIHFLNYALQEDAWKKHLKTWREYYGGNLVILPDDMKDVERVYYISLYLLGIIWGVREEGIIVQPKTAFGDLLIPYKSTWKCFMHDEERQLFAMCLSNPQTVKKYFELLYKYRSNLEETAVSYGASGFLAPQMNTGAFGEIRRNELFCRSFFVTADLARIVEQVYVITNDEEFMKETGFPLLKGFAKFFATYATKEDDGKYHLKHFCDLDEFATGNDDGIYTVKGAQHALLATIRYAEKYNDDEIDKALYKDIAENLFVPIDNEKYLRFRGDSGQGGDMSKLSEGKVANITKHPGLPGVWIFDHDKFATPFAQKTFDFFFNTVYGIREGLMDISNGFNPAMSAWFASYAGLPDVSRDVIKHNFKTQLLDGWTYNESALKFRDYFMMSAHSCLVSAVQSWFVRIVPPDYFYIRTDQKEGIFNFSRAGEIFTNSKNNDT